MRFTWINSFTSADSTIDEGLLDKLADLKAKLGRSTKKGYQWGQRDDKIKRQAKAGRRVGDDRSKWV